MWKFKMKVVELWVEREKTLTKKESDIQAKRICPLVTDKLEDKLSYSQFLKRNVIH